MKFIQSWYVFGKISDFLETGDGRILISLVGMTRFEIIKEVENKKKYREFEVNYDEYHQDFNSKDNTESEINNAILILLKTLMGMVQSKRDSNEIYLDAGQMGFKNKNY